MEFDVNLRLVRSVDTAAVRENAKTIDGEQYADSGEVWYLSVGGARYSSSL